MWSRKFPLVASSDQKQVSGEGHFWLRKFLLQRTFPIEELFQLHKQAVDMYGCVNLKITLEFTNCVLRL